MSLIAELQRRKVFKVGAAYLVVGWLLIQIAATVAPQLNLPEWAPRLITFVILLGFPVAILLAWAVDISADGIRIESAPLGNKRVVVIVAILALLSFAWYFRADLPGVRGPVERPRLAVLPIENFSPDPNNAFFADGLHDDILTSLSRLKGVDVISRTTMQTFKGSKLTLAEIAAKLNATQVLEGSVRRDATSVRLTVQLIDARSDDHLWAETYDRPLADALTLQNEVAGAVGRALKVVIGGDGKDAPPTTVPAAYDLYLKARVIADEREALRLLDSALLLDPAFTAARARRAVAACEVLWFDGTQRALLAAQARADIDRARAERPGLPAVEVAEGTYTYRVLRDYRAALAIADRTLASHPADVDALVLRAYLLRRLGRGEETIATMRRAQALEPSNPNIAAVFSEMLRFFGRQREAIRTIAAAIASGSPGMAETLSLERASAEFELTGELQPYARSVQSNRGQDRWTEDQYWWLQGPTVERMRYWTSHSGEPFKHPQPQSVVYPNALLAAVDADILGDKAAFKNAMAETERLYGTLAPEVIALPEALGCHARYLALRGDSAAAIAELERAISAVPPDKDANDAVNIRSQAIYTFARAGAKDRAIEVLKSLADHERINGVPVHATGAVLFHDKLIRAVLGDDLRYQALMKQIAARFEKL